MNSMEETENKLFEKLIKDSFLSWVHDRTFQTYLIVLTIFFLIFGTILTFASLEFIKNFVLISTGQMSAELSGLIGVVSGVAIIYFFVLYVFQYLIFAKALVTNKMSAVPITAIRLIKLILVGFAQAIAAILCLYNIKFLVIGIAGFILIMLSFLIVPLLISNPILIAIMVIMLIVGMILLAIYFVKVIINALRMLFAEVAYVEKERGIFESVKLSWTITQGQLTAIILAFIVLGIILWILNMAGSIPVSAYFSFVTQNISGTGVTNISEIFAFALDPGYILLSIPSYIISAYSIIVSTFFMTGLYDIVTKKKKIF
jgi:hypothetical protein